MMEAKTPARRALAVLDTPPAAAPLPERRISKKVRAGIEAMVTGDCKTILAAAEKAGLSREHFTRELSKPHIAAYMREKVLKQLASRPRRRCHHCARRARAAFAAFNLRGGSMAGYFNQHLDHEQLTNHDRPLGFHWNVPGLARDLGLQAADLMVQSFEKNVGRASPCTVKIKRQNVLQMGEGLGSE